MSEELQKTVGEIAAGARDKYTVHECNECTWRKCCELKFDSAKYAIPKANAALAAPARNCDKFATWKEASKAFEDSHSERVGFLNLYVDVLKWLFAPAEKGCAK